MSKEESRTSDDSRAGIKEENDRSAATRLEAEAERWWAFGRFFFFLSFGRRDNEAMEEASTVVRETMDL